MSALVGTPGALPQAPTSAAYLGQGIRYPMAFNPNTGRLFLSSGTASVSDALQAMLQTEPGERVMQPDFGASVSTFEPADPGVTRIKLEQAIADHEPRIVAIESLDVDIGPTQLEQQITIRYQVAGQATPQTLVYPFYQTP